MGTFVQQLSLIIKAAYITNRFFKMLHCENSEAETQTQRSGGNICTVVYCTVALQTAGGDHD